MQNNEQKNNNPQEKTSNTFYSNYDDYYNNVILEAENYSCNNCCHNQKDQQTYPCNDCCYGNENSTKSIWTPENPTMDSKISEAFRKMVEFNKAKKDKNIDEVLKEIGDLWKKNCPEWRLGQLISNATQESDIYYIGNNELIQMLKNYFDE